jgi:hypothetical protein
MIFISEPLKSERSFENRTGCSRRRLILTNGCEKSKQKKSNFILLARRKAAAT